MYMYYLLGYRLFGDLNIIEKLYKRKRKKNSSKNKSKLFKGFGNLLNNMDNKKRIQVKNSFFIIKKIYLIEKETFFFFIDGKYIFIST
jgi:hypothetical protein